MKTTERREFLGWLGATAMVGTAPAMLVGALPGTAAAAAPRPASRDWDMSWMGRITARHRAVFDAPDLSEGDPLLRAVVWGRQYQEVFGVRPEDTSRVLVLRHLGIHFAMNDAYWARFPIGSETGFVDGSGKGLTVNPVLSARDEVPEPFRHMTLEAFQQSGGITLACHLALTHYVVPRYVATGMSEEQALAAAMRDLVPGVIMQPSGIFAVSVAQDAGCRYVPVS